MGRRAGPSIAWPDSAATQQFTKATLAYIFGTIKDKITERDILLSIPSIAAYPAAMITPSQIRAARALLGWKQTDLAKAAEVSEISVKNIERGATDARGSTLGKIQSAFVAAGVQFLDPGQHSLEGGHGVRMLKQS